MAAPRRTPLLVAGPRMAMGEGRILNGEATLPYLTIGEWDFDNYGFVSVTPDDLDTIQANFRANARRQDIAIRAELPLNEEHTTLPPDADPASYVGPGAIGWIQDIYREDVGDKPMLWAKVQTNRLGEAILADDRYRSVSPELLLNWTDPETGKSWGKTAAGLAVTLRPRMKSLSHNGPGFLSPGFIHASEHARVLAFDEPLLKMAAPAINDRTNNNLVDVRDFKDCPTCDGTKVQNGQTCPTCKGAGKVDSQMNPYVPTDNPGGLSDQIVKAGDQPGHDFHGNQWTSGSGGGDDAEHQAHVMGMTADQTRQHLRDEHGRAGSGSASKASLQAAHLLAHSDSGLQHLQDQHFRGTTMGASITGKSPAELGDLHDFLHSGLANGVQGHQPHDHARIHAADLNSVHIDAPMKNLSVAVMPNKLSTARPSIVEGNKAGDGPPDVVGDVYAFPEQKRLPLNTAAGVTGAMARFMNIEASEQERETAWTRVITAGQHYGVKVPASWRDLKASECVRWLMQEADSDEASLHGDAYARMEQAFKDLINQETGEGEPDDVGFLAAKWQEISAWWQHELTESAPEAPVAAILDLAMAEETRATPDLPDSPAIPHEKGAAVTMDPVTPTSDPVAVETTPAPVPAPAPAPVAEPVKVSAGEKALVAELSETKALLSAERTGRLDALRKLDAAETTIANLKDASRKRETAEKMVKVTDRLDNLVKTGRITPAVRDQYAEHVAAFAESDSADVMLKGLEMLPANSAVDLRERGTSNEPPKGQNEGQRLEIAAHALMSEKGQPTDPKSKDYLSHYKDALIHVSKSGFQG